MKGIFDTEVNTFNNGYLEKNLYDYGMITNLMGEKHQLLKTSNYRTIWLWVLIKNISQPFTSSVQNTISLVNKINVHEKEPL